MYSEKDGKDGKKESEGESYTDEQLATHIDGVIRMMDKDKDGYINYYEFTTSDN